MIEFKNILDVDYDLKMNVRNWRNHPSVKQNMYNEKLITIEQHEKWLNSLLKDSKNSFYILFYKDEPCGIFSLNNISKTHLTADFGFYIRQDKKFPPVALIAEECIINFYFNEFKFEKLNCEVIQKNIPAIKLHIFFGFKEEGLREKNIIKNGKRENVVLLGLTKENWSIRNAK